LVVSHRLVYIGLLWNMRSLTVAITNDYRQKVLDLMDAPWHAAKRSFTALELERLVGKIARLGEAANWVFYLLPHLYASIAHALSANKEHLVHFSPSFRQLLRAIKDCRRVDVSQANFALQRSASQVHRSRRQYFINETMRAELSFIREALDFSSWVEWSTPIAHMIKRDPTFVAFGDTCRSVAFGCSLGARVFWRLAWPPEIRARTLDVLPACKDSIDDDVLAFIAVILNYAAVLVAVQTEGFCGDPHPLLLAVTFNRSAAYWVKKFCLRSLAGRALGRLFCGLMMNSPLGINARWLAEGETDLSPILSELRASKDNQCGYTDFVFSSFYQKCPQLQACKIFRPSDALLSLLWRGVLTKKSPTLSELRQLQLQGLGKLTT